MSDQIQGQNRATPVHSLISEQKKGLPDFSESPIKSSFLLMNSSEFYLLNNRSHTA